MLGSLRKKVAFTLAELLITIAIVGILAVMVLPTLIQRNEERMLLLQFKQTYSILQRAYQAIQGEYGDFNVWKGTNTTYNMFIPYLKVSESCHKTNGCFPNVIYPSFNPTEGTCIRSNFYTSKTEKVRLMNGASISFGATSMLVDINGDKKPNRYGYDVFTLGFSNLHPGIITGAHTENDESWMYEAGLAMCSKALKNCNQMYSGYSCAHWVIRKGNMDYIHRNLSQSEWKSLFKYTKYKPNY